MKSALQSTLSVPITWPEKGTPVCKTRLLQTLVGSSDNLDDRGSEQPTDIARSPSHRALTTGLTGLAEKPDEAMRYVDCGCSSQCDAVPSRITAKLAEK